MATSATSAAAREILGLPCQQSHADPIQSLTLQPLDKGSRAQVAGDKGYAPDSSIPASNLSMHKLAKLLYSLAASPLPKPDKKGWGEPGAMGLRGCPGLLGNQGFVSIQA